MNKRQFLATVAASTVALPSFVHAKRTEKFAWPVLLTVTGAIERTNRGPLNPALDQMMHKQKIQFDKGYCFDFATMRASHCAPGRCTILTCKSRNHRHTLFAKIA